MDDPEPVIENPEVREVNDQTTEEVEEVLEKEVEENVEETMYNPKGD